MCKGQCPGGAIDGDWRNRSSKCDLWMALFERFEAELIAEGRTPVSVSPHRAALEAFALRQWTAGGAPISTRRLRDSTPRDAASDGAMTTRRHRPIAAWPRRFERDRLPYVLPDFTRISWVSDRARASVGAQNPADRAGLGRDRVALGRGRHPPVRADVGAGRAARCAKRGVGRPRLEHDAGGDVGRDAAAMRAPRSRRAWASRSSTGSRSDRSPTSRR